MAPWFILDHEDEQTKVSNQQKGNSKAFSMYSYQIVDAHLFSDRPGGIAAVFRLSV